MQFYPGTGLGIVDEVLKLCDANITQYPIADITRRVNIALDTIVSKIIVADGRWQFDDRNYTTLPIATATLVANQQDYGFDTSHLKVLGMEVLDAAGTWHKLTPIDIQDIRDKGEAVTDYQSTTGLPQEYDKIGNSILLYPKPAAASVTLVNGLKVYFQRSADLFSTSDTTKVAGIPAPFHYLLAYMAAIPFCQSYKKDRVAAYFKTVQDGFNDLEEFYSQRIADEPKRLSPRQHDNR